MLSGLWSIMSLLREAWDRRGVRLRVEVADGGMSGIGGKSS
jgi:hypothetical protein